MSATAKELPTMSKTIRNKLSFMAAGASALCCALLLVSAFAAAVPAEAKSYNGRVVILPTALPQ